VLADRTIEWDDREVAKKVLRERGYTGLEEQKKFESGG
jgi:hypothetical protein